MKLTKRQTEKLRTKLQQERHSLEDRIESGGHYGLNSSLSDSVGELSTYDNHPADLGSELFERGKDIALNENAEHQLEQVITALEHINSGQYGQCAACGREIGFQRLMAIPTTLYCIKHVPDEQISLRRPVEEEILSPPFGRTSLDELPEQNQFDGEDAWQIVENWGNSDSPAMSEDPNIADYDHMSIEADENDGYVESLESFLATDIYGKNVTVVRNREYRKYMDNQEGDHLLEPS